MPSLQVVIDGAAEVYDARTETLGFSSNAGACLLTEAMDVYGLSPTDEESVNFESFATFSSHCDEDVALKAGGTEKRYRCAGLISLNAENEDRINAIATICNADVYVDAQGRLAVRQKMRSTPGIALRAKNGDHLDLQMESGRSLQKLFNTAKITYVEPALNYKGNEVRWQHPGLFVEDGAEYSVPVSATLCPSPTQAMRIGKLAIYEANPDFVGKLTSGPQALDLFEDYVFTLDLSPEDQFERVACATGSIEYDTEGMRVSTDFMVFGEGATDWDEDIDEQEQVIIPVALPAYVDEVPLTVTASVELQQNSAPVIKFAWDATTGDLPDSYSQQLEVSPEGADEWSPANVKQESNTAIYGPVADGGSYDWRIRNIAGGKTFDWQYSTTPVTVTVDPTAPGTPVNLVLSNASGTVSISARAPNDTHVRSLVFKRGTTAQSFAAATLLGEYAAFGNQVISISEVPGAGTWKYWCGAENISSVPSASQVSGTITV